MDIKTTVLDILSDYIELPSEDVNLDEPMKMAAGVNSFVFLSIITDIEEKFDIRIPNEKLIEFKTLGNIVDYLESQENE